VVATEIETMVALNPTVRILAFAVLAAIGIVIQSATLSRSRQAGEGD